MKWNSLRRLWFRRGSQAPCRVGGCGETLSVETATDCSRCGTEVRVAHSSRQKTHIGEIQMKGILLWLVGIPIPIIILLYFFNYL